MMKTLFLSILACFFLFVDCSLIGQPPIRSNTTKNTPGPTRSTPGPTRSTPGSTTTRAIPGLGMWGVPKSPGSTFTSASSNAVTFPYASKGALNLTVVSINTNDADLTWKIPPNFVPVSAVMEYQNSFDTTLHTIRRPASTVSAKIPRALPVGSYEQWTLTLTDSSGTSISDILGLIAVYGGVVAIEEDVIFAKVEDFCYLNYDGAYDRYYFPGNHHLVGDHPIVAEIDFTCEIVHARYLYLLDHTDYDPENQSDLDAFSEYIITTLFQKRADGDPAVSDESSLGEPDWYEEENGGPRLAQTVQKTALDAKVFPNPFQDRFILETKDLSGLAQLIVHNIQGQVIHREQLDLQGGTEEALIKTQGWAPGLYQLSLVHDSGIFSQKLIKQ